MQKKYKLRKVILFGSSKDKADARDIDIGVAGISPDVFFDFFWEIYRDISKPIDIIDLNNPNTFTKLIEKDGIVEFYSKVLANSAISYLMVSIEVKRLSPISTSMVNMGISKASRNVSRRSWMAEAICLQPK